MYSWGASSHQQGLPAGERGHARVGTLGASADGLGTSLGVGLASCISGLKFRTQPSPVRPDAAPDVTLHCGDRWQHQPQPKEAPPTYYLLLPKKMDYLGHFGLDICFIPIAQGSLVVQLNFSFLQTTC